MTSIWNDFSDVERDLWELSEMVIEPDFTPCPPPTIAHYHARMLNNQNTVFGSTPPASGGDPVIVMGRGKGRSNVVIAPGIPDPAKQNLEEDVFMRLRQVSGLGYSNELIERHVKSEKAKMAESNDSPDRMSVDDKVKLQTTTQRISSSSSSNSPSSTGTGKSSLPNKSSSDSEQQLLSSDSESSNNTQNEGLRNKYIPIINEYSSTNSSKSSSKASSKSSSKNTSGDDSDDSNFKPIENGVYVNLESNVDFPPLL